MTTSGQAPKPARVHPTALVEDGVVLGHDTSVWDGVHIRHGAKLGHHCIVGEKSYIAYDVVIGNYVKINAVVYICANVSIGDFCMISAHTVFTNDRFPRSGNKELTGLETSDVTEETLTTRLERGVTIGANATIGPGITLGEFSMIGMGSVVTRDVPAFALVHGSPARIAGWLSACGHPLLRGADLGTGPGEGSGGGPGERGSATVETPRGGAAVETSRRDLHCERCGRNYRFDGRRLTPTAPIVSVP